MADATKDNKPGRAPLPGLEASFRPRRRIYAEQPDTSRLRASPEIPESALCCIRIVVPFTHRAAAALRRPGPRYSSRCCPRNGGQRGWGGIRRPQNSRSPHHLKVAGLASTIRTVDNFLPIPPFAGSGCDTRSKGCSVWPLKGGSPIALCASVCQPLAGVGGAHIWLRRLRQNYDCSHATPLMPPARLPATSGRAAFVIDPKPGKRGIRGSLFGSFHA